jgi:hypothetical protein
MPAMNNPSFDKELYRARREKGLRGQLGYANVSQSVLTEKGPMLIPKGFINVRGKKPYVGNRKAGR